MINWVTRAGSIGVYNEGTLLQYFFEYTLVPVGKIVILAGNLPDTLTLNEDTGHLLGTLPLVNEPTFYNFTLRIINSEGVRDRSFNFTVTNSQATWITPTVITDSTFGQFMQRQEIDVQLELFDPTDNIPTFELIAGRLPNGVFLTPSGKLSGFMYDNIGSYFFTVKANTIPAITRTFQINIISPNRNPPPYFTSIEGWIGDLLDGEFFQFDITSKDLNADNVSYSLTSGTLPNGITLSQSGVVFGIPSNNPVGDRRFTVTVTDGNRSISRQFLLRTNPIFNEFQIIVQPGIGFNDDYEGTLMVDYPSFLKTNTISMSRWTRFEAITPLPPGLQINVNSGDIYGIPTTVGTYTTNIRAYNFEGFEEFIDVGITVKDNPFILPNSVSALITGNEKIEFFKQATNYKVPYEKIYRPFDPNFGIKYDPRLIIQKYTNVTPSQFQSTFLNEISSEVVFDKFRIVPVQDIDGSVRAYCLVAQFKDKTYKSETMNLDSISQYLFENGSPIPVYEPWQSLEYTPNILSNSFTVIDHPFVTGDTILFNNQDVPSPFFNDTIYYVNVVDKNTIRLAQTQQAALNGSFISFNVNEVSRNGVFHARIYGIPLVYLQSNDFDVNTLNPITATIHLQIIQVGDELVVVDEQKYLRK